MNCWICGFSCWVVTMFRFLVKGYFSSVGMNSVPSVFRVSPFTCSFSQA